MTASSAPVLGGAGGIDAAPALNPRSALLALREAARKVPDGGRVVLWSGVAAPPAPAGQSVYAAAKAGAEAAARVPARSRPWRDPTP